MALKFLILAFLAIHAQALSADSYRKISIDGITYGIDDIIEEVKEAIKAIIDEIVGIPQQIVDRIKEAVEKVLEETANQIQQAIDGVKAEIEAMMKEAIQIGQDAVACVTNLQSDVEAHITGIFSGNEQCIADVQNKGQGLITDATALIGSVDARLQKLLSDWSDCDDFVCYLSVIDDGRKEIVNIKDEAKAILNNVEDFFSNSVRNLPKCIANNIESHTKGMAQAITTARDCIVSVGH